VAHKGLAQALYRVSLIADLVVALLAAMHFHDQSMCMNVSFAATHVAAYALTMVMDTDATMQALVTRPAP
jgi:hypothetical protein